MEDGLGAFPVWVNDGDAFDVLILVLVEDGLGERLSVTSSRSWKSLNPCFSGGWSRSANWNGGGTFPVWVLILVLVEDGLGEAG